MGLAEGLTDRSLLVERPDQGAKTERNHGCSQEVKATESVFYGRGSSEEKMKKRVKRREGSMRRDRQGRKQSKAISVIYLLVRFFLLIT